MTPKTLRVRAVADILVPRFDLENVRRFVGRSPGRETAAGLEWPADPDPVEVPNIAEFCIALRAGELAPADEATARAAGVQMPASPAAGAESAGKAD